MQEVYKNLYVGNDQDCSINYDNEDYAIIHACKIHCHQKALNYKRSLPQEHPNYLTYLKDNHLFLNLVDIPTEFLPKYTDPIMQEAMQFIENNINTKKVLIHCNQGCSRSPSIALLYLAKNNLISNSNYIKTKEDFLKIYNQYSPNTGIEKYLENNWKKLMIEL
ncbi:MAG: dual specificity protein phosphatase family protein [Alphaproteobacteria bacterium]|nr:dual specificity protein phosphatase family protein [Alphaproteobacteria bacterium]